MPTAGERFRKALEAESPLQVVGTINAYSAMLAKRAGFKALYCSGAGVANASLGLPDLAMTNLNDVLIDVDRITDACDLPLIVDIDTGFGHLLNLKRTIQKLEKVGAAGVQLEDQIDAKRCGHLEGNKIISKDDMCEKIKVAKSVAHPSFVMIARTDSYQHEGLDGVITRAKAYETSGADLIFTEALTSLDEYKKVSAALSIPILANITEFGKTPLLSLAELKSAKVGVALYPLSAFRAMNQAALKTYQAIKDEGTQKSALDKMQTRDELYEVLSYKDFEKQIDDIISSN